MEILDVAVLLREACGAQGEELADHLLLGLGVEAGVQLPEAFHEALDHLWFVVDALALDGGLLKAEVDWLALDVDAASDDDACRHAEEDGVHLSKLLDQSRAIEAARVLHEKLLARDLDQIRVEDLKNTLSLLLLAPMQRGAAKSLLELHQHIIVRWLLIDEEKLTWMNVIELCLESSQKDAYQFLGVLVVAFA